MGGGRDLLGFPIFFLFHPLYVGSRSLHKEARHDGNTIGLNYKIVTKALIRLHGYGYAGWSAPLLFACNKIRFSPDETHMQVVKPGSPLLQSSYFFSL